MAASACFFASWDGFLLTFNRWQPTPTAPLVTTITSWPAGAPSVVAAQPSQKECTRIHMRALQCKQGTRKTTTLNPKKLKKAPARQPPWAQPMGTMLTAHGHHAHSPWAPCSQPMGTAHTAGCSALHHAALHHAWRCGHRRPGGCPQHCTAQHAVAASAVSYPEAERMVATRAAGGGKGGGGAADPQLALCRARARAHAHAHARVHAHAHTRTQTHTHTPLLPRNQSAQLPDHLKGGGLGGKGCQPARTIDADALTAPFQLRTQPAQLLDGLRDARQVVDVDALQLRVVQAGRADLEHLAGQVARTHAEVSCVTAWVGLERVFGCGLRVAGCGVAPGIAAPGQAAHVHTAQHTCSPAVHELSLRPPQNAEAAAAAADMRSSSGLAAGSP
eukprot:362177-Chlamydomonas_euryale.AAC.3